MYRIIDSRGSGKTSRLLLLAKETGATVICSNPWAMKQKALAYGIIGINFISYGEALGRGYEYAVKGINDHGNVLIDEIENFAQYAIANANMIGYCLSNED